MDSNSEGLDDTLCAVLIPKRAITTLQCCLLFRLHWQPEEPFVLWPQTAITWMTLVFKERVNHLSLRCSNEN